MKKIIFTICALPLILNLNVLQAQEAEKPKGPSHKGFKATMALGGMRIPKESRFEDGQTVNLSLGYGFSNSSTLWLTVQGTEFKDKTAGDEVNEYNGLELSYQYRFMPEATLQPYGRVGLGAQIWKVRDSDTSVIGPAISVALGADYFFTRHFGIGAELFFKDIEFTEQVVDGPGGEVTTKLDQNLNRDSRGFMFTLTIQ